METTCGSIEPLASGQGGGARSHFHFQFPNSWDLFILFLVDDRYEAYLAFPAGENSHIYLSPCLPNVWFG